jgi:hypothetical protein
MTTHTRRSSVRSTRANPTVIACALAGLSCALAPHRAFAGPSPAPYAVVADIDKDGQPGGITNPRTADELVIRQSDPLLVIAAFFAGDQGIARMYLENNPRALVDVATLLPSDTTDTEAADLDGDGDGDLIAADFEILTAVPQGQGGVFGPPAPAGQIGGQPLSENSVKLTDLSGDQRPEIVAVSTERPPPPAQPTGLIQVFPNNGSGGFALPITISIPNTTFSGNAVGDIDADGVDEVAVITSNAVSILRRTAPNTLTPLNAATGQPLAPTDPFSLSQIAFTGNLYEVALVNINNDGRDDIVTSNLNDVFIRVNNGNGTFGPVITLDGDSGTRKVIAADLNADGTAEILAVNNNNDVVNLWRSTGPLQWGARQDIPVGTSPAGVRLADTNADNLLDMIVLNRIDGDAEIFLNTGAGVFNMPQRFSAAFATTGGYTSVAKGDFDGDGHTDIFASTQRGELHLFRNAADGSGKLLPPITRRISFNPFVVTTLPAPPGLAGDGRDRVAAAFPGRREVVVLRYDETRPPTNPYETIQTFFAAEITPDILTSISTCDLNADGITDIALTLDNALGVGLRVFPGLATGLFDTVFTSSAPGVGGWEKFIVPAPGSGLPANRYYAADFQSGGVVELNFIGGSFVYGAGFSMGADCTDIGLGKIDADATDDLIAVRTGPTTGTVTVRKQITEPVPPPAVSFSIPRNPAGLAVGDINADGRNDLIVTTTGPANQNQYVISILNGGVNLDPNTATLHPAGERPATPILVDLHATPATRGTPSPLDGPEVVIPNRDATGFNFNASVIVLPNQINFAPPSPACRADFNTDGVVSTPDLTFFLGRFGQPATPGSQAALADFNGDGVVNTSDLTFFLGRFGQTCP